MHGFRFLLLNLGPSSSFRAHPPRNITYVIIRLKDSICHIDDGLQMAIQKSWSMRDAKIIQISKMVWRICNIFIKFQALGLDLELGTC